MEEEMNRKGAFEPCSQAKKGWKYSFFPCFPLPSLPSSPLRFNILLLFLVSLSNDPPFE
jgi:hypothetical protein